MTEPGIYKITNGEMAPKWHAVQSSDSAALIPSPPTT